jgi:hypothetical protein
MIQREKRISPSFIRHPNEHYDQYGNGRYKSIYEEYVEEALEQMKRISSNFDIEPGSRERRPLDELKWIGALDIKS